MEFAPAEGQPAATLPGAATEPCQMTASEAVAAIAHRRLSAEELLRSCLARIAKREPRTRAWLHLDADHALRQARELDKRPLGGVLHGLPLGVKDVIDTADLPTTQNSPIYPHVQVGRDAACVAVARAAGALVLGKTDTVEFASGGRKALTRNPFNPAHTPGGSSSGSAAAVADFMVPLAFGTQTGGSQIRPAAFCGIYGFKPTWGAVSREGARMSSVTLDTVGWYGRSVDDLALMGEALRLLRRAEIERVSVRGLRVGLCRSPVWDHIEPAGEAALLKAADRLEKAGAIIEELVLPPPFNGLAAAHADIVYREGGAAFLPEYAAAEALLAPDLIDKVRNTRGVTDARLLSSYALADGCRPAFDQLFGLSLDVVLTPSAPGEAPPGLHTTGNAVFNSNWTLLHVPCVGLPAGFGPGRLPVGITLVGPRFGDRRLLGVARAVAPVIDTEAEARLRRVW